LSDTNGLKKYAAELLGTFVLVLIGCGSAVIGGRFFGVEGVALAFGFSLLVIVYAIGGISGCHINPAVSISMLAAGKMKLKDAAVYILVQCIGAIVGAAVVYLMATGSPSYSFSVYGLGQNAFDAAPLYFPMASAFIAEVVLTFIFVLVIHAATSEKALKGFAGIAIGFSLVLVHLVGIPITGTSVNPARSLGPALIAGLFFTPEGGMTAINQLWLFWAAPIVGALLAAAVWKLFE
jgi:aquaporin Z